jgi:hypothetical protein
MKSIQLEPNKHESPTYFAERLGETYADSVSKDHKKKNGQFFTPKKIAQFMASYCLEDKEQIKILDPGAGTAVLSCAIVEKILTTNSKVKKIELVVYETDSNVIPYANAALDNLVLYASANFITKKRNHETYILKCEVNDLRPINRFMNGMPDEIKELEEHKPFGVSFYY